MFLLIRYILLPLIGAAQLAMLGRAILSWIPVADRIYDILCSVTEPVIAPVRYLFDKFGISNDFPIDIPFFVTFLILSVLESVLAV